MNVSYCYACLRACVLACCTCMMRMRPHFPCPVPFFYNFFLVYLARIFDSRPEFFFAQASPSPCICARSPFHINMADAAQNQVNGELAAVVGAATSWKAKRAYVSALMSWRLAWTLRRVKRMPRTLACCTWRLTPSSAEGF